MSILLNFEGEQYTLFSDTETEKTIFGPDYKPQQVDINPPEGQSCIQVLREYSLKYLIMELKQHFELDQVDISLELPQLDLLMHQDLPVVGELSMEYLERMYEAYCIYQQVENPGPLQVNVIKHATSLMKRLHFLSHLTHEGGLPSNPIIISSGDEAKDESSGEEDTLETNSLQVNVAQEDDEDELQAKKPRLE